MHASTHEPTWVSVSFCMVTVIDASTGVGTVHLGK
jgi:hypothetical protein